MIFKYLEPPLFDYDRGSEDIQEDLPTAKPKKKARIDPDYKVEPELEACASLGQSRLQLNLKSFSTAHARLNGKTTIRRMASGRGSLVLSFCPHKCCCIFISESTFKHRSCNDMAVLMYCRHAQRLLHYFARFSDFSPTLFPRALTPCN